MDKNQVNSLLLVLSNPLLGQEEEFNEWYTNIHLPEVLSLPGFISAKRYKINQLANEPIAQFRYLAIYEIHNQMLDEARASLNEALALSREQIISGKPPRLSPATTLQEARIVSWFEFIASYPPIG